MANLERKTLLISHCAQNIRRSNVYMCVEKPNKLKTLEFRKRGGRIDGKEYQILVTSRLLVD